MTEDEIANILDKIIRKHTEELDLQACFHHYLIFNEVKLIKKDK
jgi:hypothetical protein